MTQKNLTKLLSVFWSQLWTANLWGVHRLLIVWGSFGARRNCVRFGGFPKFILGKSLTTMQKATISILFLLSSSSFSKPQLGPFGPIGTLPTGTEAITYGMRTILKMTWWHWHDVIFRQTNLPHYICRLPTWSLWSYWFPTKRYGGIHTFITKWRYQSDVDV